MKIWPNISNEPLNTCKTGTIVEGNIRQSKFTPFLSIVCEDKNRVKGLISLGDGNATHEDIVNPASTNVFSHSSESELALVPDRDSKRIVDLEKAKNAMGLVVIVQSGCYLNVHSSSKSAPNGTYQFSFKTNVVDHVIKGGNNKCMAFTKWRLVLFNPNMPHVAPEEVSEMNVNLS